MPEQYGSGSGSAGPVALQNGVLLASTSVSGYSQSTNSVTPQDLGPHGWTLTFTAPPSGNVVFLINIGGTGTTGAAFLTMGVGTGGVLTSPGYGMGAQNDRVRTSAWIPVQGLTPGTSYTYTAFWYSGAAGGSVSITADTGVGVNAVGPSPFMVFATP